MTNMVLMQQRRRREIGANVFGLALIAVAVVEWTVVAVGFARLG